MTQKKLDSDSITNELEGAVAAFARPPATARASSPSDSPDSGQPATAATKRAKSPSKLAPLSARTINKHADALIDQIRKSVKSVGKEVSFVRLTTAEKQQLSDIVYTYKRQGVKTSENEINRIAVNFLIADYKAHGQASVLARVIASLLA